MAEVRAPVSILTRRRRMPQSGKSTCSVQPIVNGLAGRSSITCASCTMLRCRLACLPSAADLADLQEKQQADHHSRRPADEQQLRCLRQKAGRLGCILGGFLGFLQRLPEDLAMLQ